MREDTERYGEMRRDPAGYGGMGGVVRKTDAPGGTARRGRGDWSGAGARAIVAAVGPGGIGEVDPHATRLLAAALLAALLAAAPPAVAAPRAVEVACLGCHGGGPRPVHRPDGTVRDIAVPVAELRRSHHARLACRACHTGRFDLFPHPPRLRTTLSCTGCHPRRDVADRLDFARISTGFAASVHARREDFACERCHDPHRTAPPPEDPLARFAAANAPCIACHGAAAAGPLANPARPDLAAVHAGLPHAPLHLARTACRHCHDRAPADPLSHALPPAAATATPCTACHGRPTLLPERAPPPVPARLLAGGGLLPAFAPVGAVRLPAADATAAVLAAAFVLLLVRHRRRLPPPPGDPAAATPPWRRLWHALLAGSGVVLLVNGLMLAHGVDPDPPGYAALDGLHRLLGLAFLGLWLAGWSALAATGVLRAWWEEGREGRARRDLTDYAKALLQLRPLPAHGGTYGALQARTYALVVGGLLPLLCASGLVLLVPERTAGTWAKALALLLHHLAALAFALFLVVHAGLVLAGPRPGRALARMSALRRGEEEPCG